MQNERSASDAEMFPAGFKALGLGKVDRRADDGRGDRDGVLHAARRLGDPHAGQRRLDGHRRRTWRTTACRRTCYVDNTPGDFLKGRDAQIEKAVEVLKGEMGRKTSTSQQQQQR